MTIKQRIISCLKSHPKGVDDDELAHLLGLSARQQANMRCRELEKEGLVVRRPVNGKIHNFWMDKANIQQRAKDSSEIASSLRQNGSRDWFWEGNIQAAVIRYLVSQNYLIRSAADTAHRERGKDVVAERDGRQLWVSVKGYPKGTNKTHPANQASHWFKQAIFDIIEYRGKSDSVELGIALPDFNRYRSMASKIAWFQPVVRFTYYWVQEDGKVAVK